MLPVLFDWPHLIIYSYPLFMGLAWGVGYQICLYLLEKHNVSHRGFLGFFAGFFFSSWIGAKIFFLIHSSGDEFLTYAGASRFWTGGGFVFYGGLIFGALFAYFYLKVLRRFPAEKAYLFLPAVAISHAIGRIGCILAGCCYGTVCNLPWAVHLHNEDRHPVQLYESFLLFLLGWVLLKLVNKKASAGTIFKSYFIGYAVLRFGLEFFRGDKIRGVYLGGLSTSQYVSLGLVLAFLVYEGVMQLKRR